MEKFDFSKQDDQETVEQLSQEDKDKFIEDAHSEAVEINLYEESPENPHLARLMRLMKEGTVPIIKKLKEDIERGTYDTLISDEGGARLPTLLFKEIFNAKGPKDKRVNAKFLAFGRFVRQHNSELRDYAHAHGHEWGKVLVITEMAASGGTVLSIRDLFTECGINDYDIAVLFNNAFDKAVKYFSEENKEGEILKHKLFTGVRDDWDNPRGGDFAIFSRQYSGVKKQVVTNDGKVSIVGAFPTRIRESNGNSEDDIQSQEKMNRAREDIKILARDIIREVWGQEVERS